MSKKETRFQLFWTVDVWQAVKPERVGLRSWPEVPRGTDIKHGTLQALGWPHATRADVARGWRRILATVRSYKDLEPALLGRMEELGERHPEQRFTLLAAGVHAQEPPRPDDLVHCQHPGQPLYSSGKLPRLPCSFAHVSTSGQPSGPREA